MPMQYLPKCNDPEKSFELLRQNEDGEWHKVEQSHNKQLDHDIEQSIMKALRTYDLYAEDYNILGLVFEINRQTWDKFREIVTASDSSFVFSGQEDAYKFVRKTSWTFIQKLVKKLNKQAEEHISLDTFDNDDESQSLDNSLDNFLYQQGGYDDTNPEDEIELMCKIDALIEAIDVLKPNPDHVQILMHRVFDGTSSKELAEKFGFTSNSIDQTIHRLKKTLREYLLQQEEIRPRKTDRNKDKKRD